MPIIKYNFYSRYLRVNTTVSVIIPSYFNGFGDIRPLKEVYDPQTKYKSLYLLHGASEDNNSWLRNTAIERYAEKKKLAVIMPSAYNSCYTDMAHGIRYFQFLSEELPLLMQAVFPLSDKKEDHFVAGNSMGGRGAFLWALKKPEFFHASACLSGSLDINKMADRMSKQNDWDGIKRFENVFGDIRKLKDSEHDVYWLAKKMVESQTPQPKLLYSCGTEDVRYEEQFLPFIKYAKQIGLKVETDQAQGDHDYAFWDRCIERVIDWFLPA